MKNFLSIPSVPQKASPPVRSHTGGVKLCMTCGKPGHIAGVECPEHCSICGGILDEGKVCFGYRCNETAQKCPTGCDHHLNLNCAFR